jgi:hypothetical protein
MFTLVGAPAWVVNVMVVETKERPSIRRTKSETAKDAEVNFPFAAVLTLVVCPVVLLVMKTFAPLIGPPFVDETVPVIVAVPASWAPAADRKNTKIKENKPRHRGNRRVKHKFPDTILMGNV